MPTKYSSSVRRQVCLRLLGGEPVAEITADTGISPATLFRWKAKDLILGWVRATRGTWAVDVDKVVTRERTGPVGEAGTADDDMLRIRRLH